MLGCLSMGLLTHLRSELTSHLCQLMTALDSSTDYVLTIHQLLRGAFMLLHLARNISSGCRLALVNGNLSKALVFEPDRKGSLQNEGGATANARAANPSNEPQIHATEISLENTLLLDAVQKVRGDQRRRRDPRSN